MNELFELQRKDLIDYINNKYEGDNDGIIETDIPSLFFYKTSSLSEFISIIYEPSICLALQGSKAVGFGDKMYGYDKNKYLLASTNVPANVRIEEASSHKPYVSLKITFTLEQIYEVLKELEGHEPTKVKGKVEKGLFFDDMNITLLNPISRLTKLLDSPKKNIDFMAPLIIKEILYILLSGASGDFLKQYVMEGTVTNQIVKVISEIKNNFAETLNMKELAEKFDMSESSLYHSFKKITMLSPLQFQKKLRLEEAKQLLLNQKINVNEVAFVVGYESPSQFSREYSRMFGLPPKAHINSLKELIA
ncbi:AraC family transcriptional regulator [Aliarcobacter butzleri]|uniref:AraC family transcriptional regulator n=1 Tax=Aliarcobacter butzleri TaxID=28197 RepID=UPI00344FFDE6